MGWRALPRGRTQCVWAKAQSPPSCPLEEISNLTVDCQLGTPLSLPRRFKSNLTGMIELERWIKVTRYSRKVFHQICRGSHDAIFKGKDFMTLRLLQRSCAVSHLPYSLAPTAPDLRPPQGRTFSRPGFRHHNSN